MSAYDLYNGFPVASASSRRKDTAIRSTGDLYRFTGKTPASPAAGAAQAFFPEPAYQPRAPAISAR